MTPSLVLGLAFILTHEMDAVAAKEWRMIPLLCRLGNDAARRVFIVAHVPLFGLALWGLTGPGRETWTLGIDVFVVLHVGLHLLLARHPENGFRREALSWTLIVGAGVSGAVGLFW